MAQIFISYSRKDVDFARKLAASLSDLGADIWIDVEDIPAGMNWSYAIQQGLDQCDILLLVMSPESMNSKNVENEWQYVLDQGKSVIPIRWRPAKPHFQLNRLQYHDFHNRDYEQAFRGLHFSLIYQGIDLPAVKGDAKSPPSPHSTPFLGDAPTSDTTPTRTKRRWLFSMIGLLSLLIVLAIGASILKGKDGSETTDKGTSVTLDGDTIASVMENRADIATISQIASGSELLSSSQELTFFATADSYFQEDDNEALILTTFRDDFPNMIELHTVVGIYTLDDLRQMDGQTLTTVAGTQLTITLSPPSLVLINDASVLDGDIDASNGVVHILDGFLWSP